MVILYESQIMGPNYGIMDGIQLLLFMVFISNYTHMRCKILILATLATCNFVRGLVIFVSDIFFKCCT